MRSPVLPLALIMILAGCGDDAPASGDPDGGTPDAGTAVCPAPPVSLPGWMGQIPSSASLTTTAYGFTGTGLATAVTVAQGISGPPYDVSYGADATGVRVLAVESPDGEMLAAGVRHMIVADGAAVMKVNLSSVGVGLSDPWPLPGDRLDITLERLALSFGMPQIVEILDWMADSLVSSDNSVYYRESTGVALDVSTLGDFGTPSSDLYWLHHLYGEVISGPTSCGANHNCWDLRHGGSSGQLVTIRDRNTALLVVGDCVELYAPLSQFEGDPQFELWQYQDSYRVYPTP